MVDLGGVFHHAAEHALHEGALLFAGLHAQKVDARIFAAFAAHFPFVDQFHGVRARRDSVHLSRSF